jgi:hypothetical protein
MREITIFSIWYRSHCWSLWKPRETTKGAVGLGPDWTRHACDWCWINEVTYSAKSICVSVHFFDYYKLYIHIPSPIVQTTFAQIRYCALCQLLAIRLAPSSPALSDSLQILDFYYVLDFEMLSSIQSNSAQSNSAVRMPHWIVETSSWKRWCCSELHRWYFLLTSVCQFCPPLAYTLPINNVIAVPANSFDIRIMDL